MELNRLYKENDEAKVFMSTSAGKSKSGGGEYLADLQGKTLLVIGATAYFIDVALICRDAGIRTVMLDYNPRAVAKSYADIALDVDTYNVDAVTHAAKEYAVDGVFVGWSDRNLYTALEVCKRLSLPFYATKAQLNATSDKSRFKSLCRRFGIQVFDDFIMSQADDECPLNFPVIVKPVDSGGNRGMTICQTKKELPNAYNLAVGNSLKSNVLVEEVAQQAQHINAYYTMSGGKIRLSAICDRLVTYPAKGYPPLPSCLIHPSKNLSEWLNYVDPKVCALLSSLEIRDGIAFFQGFMTEHGIVLYEMGYRFNGGSTYFFMDYYQGYNQVAMMIRHALTGSTGLPEGFVFCNADFARLGCTLVYSVRSGRIAKIKGIEEIELIPNVIRILKMKSEGDVVDVPRGVSQAQIFLYVYVDCAVLDDLIDIEKRIDAVLRVESECGEDLLIERMPAIDAICSRIATNNVKQSTSLHSS